MAVADKVMDHAAYPRKLKDTKRFDEAALRFTIKDAGEAIKANPDNPNNGYYRDEQLYCAAELRRRGLA